MTLRNTNSGGELGHGGHGRRGRAERQRARAREGENGGGSGRGRVGVHIEQQERRGAWQGGGARSHAWSPRPGTRVALSGILSSSWQVSKWAGLNAFLGCFWAELGHGLKSTTVVHKRAYKVCLVAKVIWVLHTWLINFQNMILNVLIMINKLQI